MGRYRMAIERSRIGANLARKRGSQKGFATDNRANPCEPLCEHPVQVQCEPFANPIDAGSNEPNENDFANPIFKNYLENSIDKVELNLRDENPKKKKVVFENGARIALNRSIAVDAWGHSLRVTGQSKYFLYFQTKTGPVILSRSRASEMLSFGYLHFAGGIWRQTFNTLEAMKDSPNLYLIRCNPHAHVKTVEVTELMRDVAEVFGAF